MIIQADSTKPFPLADGSVDCVVTSPPYFGLRDYGVAGQVGLESTPEAFVEKLVGVFGEVRRVLKPEGTVWHCPTYPYPSAHFATFPPALIEPCVLAGCPVGGLVLDPFAGAGTTGVVAKRTDRNFVGFELNPEYCRMAAKRIDEDVSQRELAI